MIRYSQLIQHLPEKLYKRINGKSVSSSEGFGFVPGLININDGIQAITVNTSLTNAEKIPLFANKGDLLNISTALNNSMINQFYSDPLDHIASAVVASTENLSFTTTLTISNTNDITSNDTVADLTNQLLIMKPLRP